MKLPTTKRLERIAEEVTHDSRQYVNFMLYDAEAREYNMLMAACEKQGADKEEVLRDIYRKGVEAYKQRVEHIMFQYACERVKPRRC